MTNQAVFVDLQAPKRLVIREAPVPTPLANETLVQVKAISLNRGEVRRSFTTAPDGWRPGWDVAGEVLEPAPNGTGPKKGDRVVGLMRGGGWSELIALDNSLLAVIPEGVSYEAASTLPVAGLTALHALYQGGQGRGYRREEGGARCERAGPLAAVRAGGGPRLVGALVPREGAQGAHRVEPPHRRLHGARGL